MLTSSRHSYKFNCISSISWGKCFFYALLLPFLFLFSCKNPDNIGLDVIPASDHLNTLYTDTITVTSSTVLEDSLRSDEVSQILLGSISDVVFGTSTASLYTQVLLGQTPNLGDSSLTADSVVLSFAYSNSYGNTSTPLTVHVYKLAEDMHLDSSYYTNRTFLDSAVDLAVNNQFTPKPSDSVMVGTANQPPQLRILLAQSFANELVALNGSSQYGSNDAWKAYFKGFYIKVDAVTGSDVGSILYFSPTSAYTKMTLYYHEDTVARSYDFTFSNAARVNHQTHDYTGSQVGMQLINSSFNDSLTYIQSMAGLKASISFPYFKHIIDSGKILINKAELAITVPENTDTGFYSAPSSIFLTAKDSVGGLTFVTDYLDQLISFGGVYAPTTNTYKFNIGRHLQRILDGHLSDYGFSLNIVSSVVQANRVIIGSGKGTANPAKMKLNLFYTKL
jgi:hypothetical protein